MLMTSLGCLGYSDGAKSWDIFYSHYQIVQGWEAQILEPLHFYKTTFNFI